MECTQRVGFGQECVEVGNSRTKTVIQEILSKDSVIGLDYKASESGSRT